MAKYTKSNSLEEVRIKRTEIIGTIALQYLQSIRVQSTSR